ncbi:BCCT family transporter [Campylobacter sp. Cr9]|uniref:BCCT family transporter n=1 Tax=Campylobacter sp. Cr9 TaxID=2735728 RepID=UPI00309B063F|nr:BCCT family transporter [Campylobacter sp. Cr9]
MNYFCPIILAIDLCLNGSFCLAYMIYYSVVTLFFIAKILYGRSFKNIIFGGLFFGLLGTFVSFMIMSNYRTHL